MALQTAKFRTAFTDWADAFDEWRVVVDMDIVDAWRQQGKLIAERLIGGVGGGSNWNRATPPGTRKQGELAMARDIRRAVFPLKGEGFYSVRIKKRVNLAVREGDVATLQKMVASGVFGAKNVSLKVLPAGNEWTAHQNSRASRGRVTSKTPKYAVPGDTYLKKYIADQKKAVGNGKGGWVNSLMTLGGSAPQWIERHRRAGTFIDNLKRGRQDLSFTMINKSKWAEGGDEDRIIETVMADRAEAIKLDIANKLELRWKTLSRSR